MNEGFRHEVDEARIHEVSVEPYVYPECLVPVTAEIIDKKFLKELKYGRYIVNKNIKIKARIPIFTKQEGPAKWRVIPNYTYKGRYNNKTSINELIPYKSATVELPTTKHVVRFVDGNGQNHWLGKNDNKSHFRQIEMNRKDWEWSVYRWRGIDFVDTRMPWGTRCAAKVAHHVSLAITYVAYKYIPRSLQPCILDYIDDHIIATKTQTQCYYVHVIYLLVAGSLGMPVKFDKTVLASQVMIALGFILDMVVRWVQPTQEKIKKYSYALIDTYHSATKSGKELQSVAGKLQHIAFLKYPMRCYMNNFYRAIPPYNSPYQIVPITQSIKQACIAWLRALPLIGGRKFERILSPPTEFDQTLTTDASDLGFGGHIGTHWFYGAWFDDEVKTGDKNNIRERELFAPLIAATTLAPQWDEQVILLKIDNTNAKDAIVKKSIASEKAQNMVIRLCELMMEFNFELWAEYINTSDNSLADSLSRLKINKFKSECAEMGKEIDPAPLCLKRIPFEPGVIDHGSKHWAKVVEQ